MTCRPFVYTTPLFPRPEEVFTALGKETGLSFLDSSFDINGLGRYSFIAFKPFRTLSLKGSTISIYDSDGLGGTTVRSFQTDNPFEVLQAELRPYWCKASENDTLPFTSGAVGYLSYELLRYVENVAVKAPEELDIPEMVFNFHDRLMVFDNKKRLMYTTGPDEEAAKSLWLQVEKKLSMARGAEKPSMKSASRPEIVSSFTRPDYLDAVRRARKYIKAGDIYQVNLSQRFCAETARLPQELYLSLRKNSPAPFSAYLDFGKFQVLSSSPERFISFDGVVVETRPIKGTRPRGKTPEEDKRLAQELQNSPKDKAENIMIVDLERNDLGRVCQYGSVEVTRSMDIESFEQVHHLVSTVKGRVKPGITTAGLLSAVFPGGSITGAPKVRAMEIINELEPTRRDVYTGSIGYIGFDGRMDFNIAIRTMILCNNRAWFSAGGGIVADSSPEAEYQETLDKARGIFQTLKGE